MLWKWDICHIDTAQAYGNEEGVGKAIRKSNIARQDLFITSKVAAEAKTYQEAYDSINETLNKMGLDYLDLMIIIVLNHGKNLEMITGILKKIKKYGKH